MEDVANKVRITHEVLACLELCDEFIMCSVPFLIKIVALKCSEG